MNKQNKLLLSLVLGATSMISTLSNADAETCAYTNTGGGCFADGGGGGVSGVGGFYTSIGAIIASEQEGVASDINQNLAYAAAQASLSNNTMPTVPSSLDTYSDNTPTSPSNNTLPTPPNVPVQTPTDPLLNIPSNLPLPQAPAYETDGGGAGTATQGAADLQTTPNSNVPTWATTVTATPDPVELATASDPIDDYNNMPQPGDPGLGLFAGPVNGLPAVGQAANLAAQQNSYISRALQHAAENTNSRIKDVQGLKTFLQKAVTFLEQNGAGTSASQEAISSIESLLTALDGLSPSVASSVVSRIGQLLGPVAGATKAGGSLFEFLGPIIGAAQGVNEYVNTPSSDPNRTGAAVQTGVMNATGFSLAAQITGYLINALGMGVPTSDAGSLMQQSGGYGVIVVQSPQPISTTQPLRRQ